MEFLRVIFFYFFENDVRSVFINYGFVDRVVDVFSVNDLNEVV